jgi:5-methylcytosine-specific restriction endonuclease McrA
MTIKICTTCKEFKDLEHYYKDKRAKDGKFSRCISCQKEAGRKYYHSNKERFIEYYEENREKYKEYNSEYYQANKETFAENSREYRTKHKEELATKKSEYNKANPHKAKERNAQRRNRYASDGTITKSEYQSALAAHIDVHSNRWPYCDHEYSPTNKVTLDHIVPIAKGGMHSMYNIQFMCLSCNSSKNARDLDDWLAHIHIHGLPNEVTK